MIYSDLSFFQGTAMIDDILREWAMAKMDAADNPARLLAARGADAAVARSQRQADDFPA